MSTLKEILERLDGRLIVSCQASDGMPFRNSEAMADFARAAVLGGAAGIRANGAEDIGAIRSATDLPIIGIEKRVEADGRILITGSMEAARRVAEAGADIIALDCTARGRRYGCLERLRQIRSELRMPVMADIATVEEAVAAAEAGADLVASTMRGYTAETEQILNFEPAFIAELAKSVAVPVLAEGRVHTPEQARAALHAGALAVIIGAAITRPDHIARSFAEAMAAEKDRQRVRHVLAIDLGGTNTKFGVVSSRGELVAQASRETPWSAGRASLLAHLADTAARCREMAGRAGIEPAALGVATAGWVNPFTGRVVYATDNLPGWTGAPIAEELAAATGLRVAVENDANALAVAEKHFGAARECEQFICITLGTGLGGGAYVGGRLNRGANFFANAFGHIPLEAEGEPCTCGRRGCLEAYTNAAALVRYAGGRFGSAEEVIRAANGGDAGAVEAVHRHALRLAQGCRILVQLFDPEMLIVSGGLAQNNPRLFETLEGELAANTPVWELRRTRIVPSTLGYFGGVLGAAAVAFDGVK